MLRLLSYSFLLVTSNVLYNEAKVVENLKPRIVGGEAASIEKFPYQVQLIENGKEICGGVIFSEKWILSAAHCIVTPAEELGVITGSDKLASGGQFHKVKRTIVHSGYDDKNGDNDISLIELKDSIKFDATQKPIELATTVPEVGDKIIVSGFGREYQADDAPPSPVLKAAAIPVVDFTKCRDQYIRTPISTSVFCAGEGPTDACQGDSGGPAVMDGILVGIVSAGMDCGDKLFPGLYTRVANYRQWINDTITNKPSQRPTNNQSPKYPTKNKWPKYPTKNKWPKYPTKNKWPKYPTKTVVPSLVGNIVLKVVDVASKIVKGSRETVFPGIFL